MSETAPPLGHCAACGLPASPARAEFLYYRLDRGTFTPVWLHHAQKCRDAYENEGAPKQGASE